MIYKSKDIISTYYWLEDISLAKELPILPPNFFKNYLNERSGTSEKPFLIHSFKQIEWEDPFEDEDKDKKQDN